MPCSESQKKANLKWNAKNKEYMRGFHIINMNKYTNSHRDIVNKRNIDRYHFLQECKRFRNILL
jgi:hypothetical protein